MKPKAPIRSPNGFMAGDRVEVYWPGADVGPERSFAYVMQITADGKAVVRQPGLKVNDVVVPDTLLTRVG